MPGLIVNELLTNSLKYAFPDERHGEITIDLRKTTSEIIQLILKDGVGQTKDESLKGGLVKKLIELLTQQLDGTMKVIYSPGTQYFFEFKVNGLP